MFSEKSYVVIRSLLAWIQTTVDVRDVELLETIRNAIKELEEVGHS